MEKIVIIDGNSLINRAFYAMPLLTNAEGLYLNAVYGFANMLCKVITEEKPSKIAVCFDTGKPTFRHLQNKNYKATRKGMPEELVQQMPLLKELLKEMNIKYIEKEGFEADDLIGSLTKKFDGQKIVISGDKDLFQLIDNSTTVWHTKKGITEYLEMNEKNLMDTMDIMPSQVVTLKALMGDNSDNISGVAGIGPKTALSLLKTYDTLDNIYNHIYELKDRLQEKLISGKNDAYESKWLATIKTDVDLDVSINDFNYDFPFSNKVYNLMKRFEFKSILKRTSLFENKESDLIEQNNIVSNDIETILINDKNSLDILFDKIKEEKHFCVDFGKNIDIYINNKEYIISIKEDLLSVDGFDFCEFIDLFEDILIDEDIKKTVYDSKNLKHFLLDYSKKIYGIEFDVSLSEYLVKCGTKIEQNLNDLLLYNSLDVTKPAYGLFKLRKKYELELKYLEMDSLYYNIELPLVDCLFDMEITGVKMDKEELIRLKNNFSNQIENLTNEIYFLVGKEFNINSPKQLGDVLYTFLQLPNNKKNSTANEVLVKLINYHPVIEKIIYYRKVSKISSYVDAFLEKIDKKDNKLHTIYQQKLTTTGRLSSIEPNLQNVPVRDDIGKSLRKAFISSFENGYLISSDYSQIELKLLANFSKDEKLISAYKNGIDIHTKTASEIFSLSKEEVSPEMRKKAKAINFGIIYGISEYGLSETIHSSVKEAKEYMGNYFNAFPKIKTYLDGLIDIATERGYSITLFNRRRKIPELSSSNYNLKLFGKRVSMNMPLQGTASDIIKIAMNRVSKELSSRLLKSKLILQIHDELIVDCPAEELEEVKEILRNCMENVLDLEIPLTCDISYGKNWLEAL